ncbi:MAG: hypothetical protein HQL03_02275 [Nitrospirae bacterium]|nr:hypothetical protein [Nitrospirota bacterium]
MRWFRLHSEFAYDPRVQRLDEKTQRRYVMLLCFRCDDRLGKFSDDDLCYAMDISYKELMRTKKLLIGQRLIDESWNILGWEKRQYLSDSSAKRTQKYRDRKRHCDVTETSHDVTGVTGVTDVTGVTSPETETETYTETDTESRVEATAATARVDIDIGKDFIDGLSTKAAYASIDVRAVYEKLVIWCEIKGEKVTRQRLVSWLNSERQSVTSVPAPLFPSDKGAPGVVGIKGITGTTTDIARLEGESDEDYRLRKAYMAGEA